MRSSIPFYILLALAIIGLNACYKDLGNYAYTEPNQVLIGGIQEKYAAMQGDYFEIIPQLSFTDAPATDSARYRYEWVAMKVGALVADKRKDLGQAKSLRMQVNMTAGKYRVYYRLVDTATGIQFQKSFDLEVGSPIYEGWMLMTEVNGKPRLDMVNKLKDQYTIIPDVLQFAGSALELKGKPVAVHCFVSTSLANGYNIYMSTDQSANKMDAETFEYKSTHNIKYDMVSNVPDNFAPSIFSAYQLRTYMLEGTDVYYSYYPLNIRWSLPVNILRNETNTFPVAPFIAMSTLSDFTCLFDQANKRFVRHSGNEANCSLMPTGDLFDFNVGMDLVWMGFTPFNDGNVMAVLFDAANQKYMMARFVFGSTIKQLAFEEMTATDIAQARNFAISPNLGYILYTVGGKLYSYDMFAKASKLMLDRGNEVFTAAQFRGNDLVLGSYDPAKPEGANGKLEEFTVPPVQGDLVQKNSWTGMGKIVSMSYRVR